MRSSMTSLASFAFLTAWLIKDVAAGAVANVRLCIWLDVVPFEQIDINFTTCTSASRCMYCKRDQDVSFSTKKKGLSCTQENNFYVESKAGSSGGDTCLTDRSYWDVVFTGPDIFSGQLTTQWVGFDTVKIVPERNTYKTAICAAPGQCESYSTSWKSGEVGNIWIVVFPYRFGKSDGSSEGAMAIEGDERDVRARLENMYTPCRSSEEALANHGSPESFPEARTVPLAPHGTHGLRKLGGPGRVGFGRRNAQRRMSQNDNPE